MMRFLFLAAFMASCIFATPANAGGGTIGETYPMRLQGCLTLEDAREAQRVVTESGIGALAVWLAGPGAALNEAGLPKCGTMVSMFTIIAAHEQSKDPDGTEIWLVEFVASFKGGLPFFAWMSQPPQLPGKGA